MKENDGRHKRLQNIKGKKYGKLTVLYYNNDLTWHCKCDCGNYVDKRTANIVRPKYPNCGCERYWWTANLRHNHSQDRIYNIYEKMKSRCYTKTCVDYKNYGQRGILVCDDWLGANGFKNFYNWAINHGYNNSLTIDRVDVDGNYTPDNCRWITIQEQQRNKRSNKFITYNGKSQTVSQWAIEYDMPYDRLWARLKNGWSVEDALLSPRYTQKK